MVAGGVIVVEGFHQAPAPRRRGRRPRRARRRGPRPLVNLERASPRRTPPCVAAIVEVGSPGGGCHRGPRRPRPGRRFATWEHGVEVVTGVLAAARRLKPASSSSAPPDGPSSPQARAVARRPHGGPGRLVPLDQARPRAGAVHERRLESDGVMTGSGTVLADDPELTVRTVDATRQPFGSCSTRVGGSLLGELLRGAGGDDRVTTASSSHECRRAGRRRARKSWCSHTIEGSIDPHALLDNLAGAAGTSCTSRPPHARHRAPSKGPRRRLELTLRFGPARHRGPESATSAVAGSHRPALRRRLGREGGRRRDRGARAMMFTAS